MNDITLSGLVKYYWLYVQELIERNRSADRKNTTQFCLQMKERIKYEVQKKPHSGVELYIASAKQTTTSSVSKCFQIIESVLYKVSTVFFLEGGIPGKGESIAPAFGVRNCL